MGGLESLPRERRLVELHQHLAEQGLRDRIGRIELRCALQGPERFAIAGQLGEGGAELALDRRGGRFSLRRIRVAHGRGGEIPAAQEIVARVLVDHRDLGSELQGILQQPGRFEVAAVLGVVHRDHLARHERAVVLLQGELPIAQVVAPDPGLLPGGDGERQADGRREREARGAQADRTPDGERGHSPDGHDQQAQLRDVAVAIRHPLVAHLDQADRRDERRQVPEPSHRQIGPAATPEQDQTRRGDPQQGGCREGRPGEEVGMDRDVLVEGRNVGPERQGDVAQVGMARVGESAAERKPPPIDRVARPLR